MTLVLPCKLWVFMLLAKLKIVFIQLSKAERCWSKHFVILWNIIYQNVIYNSQPKPLPMYKKQYHICDVLLHHFKHTHTSHHHHLPNMVMYTFISELCLFLFFISSLLNCSTLHPDTLHQHTATPNKNGFHMKHLMLNPIYLLLVMTATCTQNTLYF